MSKPISLRASNLVTTLLPCCLSVRSPCAVGISAISSPSFTSASSTTSDSCCCRVFDHQGVFIFVCIGCVFVPVPFSPPPLTENSRSEACRFWCYFCQLPHYYENAAFPSCMLRMCVIMECLFCLSALIVPRPATNYRDQALGKGCALRGSPWSWLFPPASFPGILAASRYLFLSADRVIQAHGKPSGRSRGIRLLSTAKKTGEIRPTHTRADRLQALTGRGNRMIACFARLFCQGSVNP